MATAAVRGVLSALTRSDATSDATLLRRFATGGEEGAFSELVRRHGPLVLGVCRRVVADSHLAEDVFQAVFVVLARKAGAIDPTRLLGPWLYGVAYRVALRARTMIGRRRKRESLSSHLPEVPHMLPPVDDLAAVVDEEIARLSAVCREAVVLCELQGVSRKEAAKRLGIAEGTLSSRLAAARKTLAERLRKRGVTIGAGLVLPTVSSDLLASTVAASTGQVTLSPHLLTLVEGASRMALLNSMKLTFAAVVVALAVGGLGLWRSTESTAAPVPQEQHDEGRIWTYNSKSGVLTSYTPSGKKEKELTLRDGRHLLAVTPDGQQMLYAAKKGELPEDSQTLGDGLTLHLRPIGVKTAGTDLGIPFDPKRDAHRFNFTRDGKRLVYSRAVAENPVGGMPCTHSVIDLATKRATILTEPAHAYVVDVSADGTLALAHEYANFAKNPPGGAAPPAPHKLYSVPLDGTAVSVLAERPWFKYAALAPDGKSVLASGSADGSRQGVGSSRDAVLSIDVATRAVTQVAQHEMNSDTEVGWSPDGKRIAYLWLDVKPLPKFPALFEANKSRLVVCDPDGTKSTTREVHDFVADPKGYTRLLGWLPAKPDLRKKGAPVPKSSKLVLSVSGTKDGTTFYDRIVAVDPTSGEFTTITEKGYRGRVSPDGVTLVFEHDNAVWNVATDGSNNPGKLFSDGGYGGPVPSRDGKHLYVSQLKSELGLWRHETIRTTADGSDQVPVKLPEGEAVLDVSPDGRTFLTRSRVLPTVNRSVLYAMEAEGKNRVQLSPDGGFNEPARFSPDGKRVAFVRIEKGVNSAWVVGSDGKNPVKVYDEAGGHVEGVCWSPDGERVAVIAADLGDKGLIPFGRTDGRWRVELVTSDGKEKTTLPLKLDEVRSIRSPDWFAPPKADVRRKNAPVPKPPPPEGVILVSRFSHAEPDKLVEVLDAAGKSAGYLKLGELTNVRQTRVSPDGKKLAFVRTLPLSGADSNARGKYEYPADVYVVDLPLTEVPKAGVLRGVIDPSFAWAADGKSLYVSSIPADADVSQESLKGKMIPKRTVLFDVVTKAEKNVKLPEFHAVQDVSADGKTLLTRTKMWHPDQVAYSTHVVPLDTLKPKLVGDEDDGFAEARLSPDGSRVLGTKVKFTKSKEPGLFVADVVKGQVEAVPLNDVTADTLDSLAWAPDGKRLAVLWRGLGGGQGGRGGGAPGAGGAEAHRITVMDADGKNAKTIREFRAGEWQYQIEWADPKLAEPGRPKKN